MSRHTPPLARCLRIDFDRERYAVGLMGGTSLDGIDAALVRIKGSGDAIQLQTLSTHHSPYTPEERNGLLQLIHFGTVGDLCTWDAYLGERFAQAASEVINLYRHNSRHSARSEELLTVHFIGSHGQTVWHAPDGKLFNLPARNTLQIGQPDVIAARLGVPVVADFRTRDIVHGGQGAPLVPIVDWLLLRHPAEHRVALNIGGMANVTVLPAGGAPETILAFDTGPGNALIDRAVQIYTQGKQTYDRDGKYAAEGEANQIALEQMLSHPYFEQSPPKSTGREMFGEEYLKAIIVAFEMELRPLVATLTEFTARTIADGLKRFVLPEYPIQRIIVSGGGVHNRTLMARLQAHLPNIAVEISAQYGIDPDFKEAIAFAALADRFLQGLPTTYPNTTGVCKPCTAGKLALP